MDRHAPVRFLIVSSLTSLGCASNLGPSAKAEDTSEDDAYAESTQLFRSSASGRFFEDCFGYAIFPTVAKGGLAVGASYGRGRVYVEDRHVGNARLTALSVGWQLGGQAFSQIVFFEDERAFRNFSSGSFEFGATAQAVALTAEVEASSTTGGSSAKASGGSGGETSVGSYSKGYAVFTIARGGLMVQAAIAGQKYSYEAVASE